MGSQSTKCCFSNCMQHVRCPGFCRCGVGCKLCCECCQCASCCEDEEDEEDLVQYISAFDVRAMEQAQAKHDPEQARIYANGDKYIGEWQAGKRHGFGELIKADGTSLKGYFFEDNYIGENSRPYGETLVSDADHADFGSARLVIRKATLESRDESKTIRK